MNLLPEAHEPKRARFDDARMNGPDGHFVNLLPLGKQVRPKDLPAAVTRNVPGLEAKSKETQDGADGETIMVRLDQPLHEIIERVLGAALDIEGGNRSRAARRLGIRLRTVQRHLTETPHRPTKRRKAERTSQG